MLINLKRTPLILSDFGFCVPGTSTTDEEAVRHALAAVDAGQFVVIRNDEELAALPPDRDVEDIDDPGLSLHLKRIKAKA